MENNPHVLYCTYKGNILEFKRVTMDDIFSGYTVRCPMCNTMLFINTNVHSIEVIDNKLTLHPSLGHIQPFCGWHVWVNNGAIVDC